MPPAVVNRLNSEIEKLAQRKDVRDELAKLYNEPFRQSPAAFTDLIRSDVSKWGKVIKAAGITPN